MDPVHRSLGAHGGRLCRRRSTARQQDRAVHVQLQRVPRGAVRRLQDARRTRERQLPLSRRGAVVSARQQRCRSPCVPFVARRPCGACPWSPTETEAARRSRRWRHWPGTHRASVRGDHRQLRPHAAHHTRRRRHLHALHRRHHRHAQGRHVRNGRHDRWIRDQRLSTTGCDPAIRCLAGRWHRW